MERITHSRDEEPELTPPTGMVKAELRARSREPRTCSRVLTRVVGGLGRAVLRRSYGFQGKGRWYYII